MMQRQARSIKDRNSFKALACCLNRPGSFSHHPSPFKGTSTTDLTPCIKPMALLMTAFFWSSTLSRTTTKARWPGFTAMLRCSRASLDDLICRSSRITTALRPEFLRRNSFSTSSKEGNGSCLLEGS